MLTKLTKFMTAAGEGGGGGGEDLDAKIAAALAVALPKALNGVVTSHLKRVMAPIEERFAKLEKPPGGDEGEGDEGGGETPAAPKGKGAAAGGLPPEVQQQLAQMQKRLDKAEREAKAEKEKWQAEETKRLTTEDRSVLSKVLGEKKVTPEMMSAAVALLYGEEKRIVRSADGKHRWRDDDDTEIDLAEGADKFLKTPTGQRFLPPTGAQGGGSGPGSKPQPGGSPLAGESLMSLLSRAGTPGGQG